MLSEILDTRVMIKNRMKFDKDDKLLQQKLNSWQLALKLTANVTYGYTSATFSGRMPCVEIADAIVQSGKETLEKAISLIHSEERWGAEVVYGDTDSLFVHLKGKTKDEAFDIGEEIAERVTAMNPKPIKLKFEKVYLPCVLMAMKRYVGFKYEHRDQKEPEFDAKGIETVRRDGTLATQKMQETALKILFRTSDLSQVKDYCIRQWAKIQQDKVSIQDFCFSKEVKLGTYSEDAPLQPGVKIAMERIEADHRDEPQYGERIPFVVHAGDIEKKNIAQRSVEVQTLLRSDHLALDADYYIKKKIIPPLARIFNLVGADVLQWYNEMPKYRRLRRIVAKEEEQQVGKKGKRAVTLDKWLSTGTLECMLCRKQIQPGESKLLFPFRPKERPNGGSQSSVENA
jgi:DNA polymerase zeta